MVFVASDPYGAQLEKRFCAIVTACDDLRGIERSILNDMRSLAMLDQ